MFDDFVFDVEQGKKYEFAAGRNFVHDSPAHGFNEAVVGAKVARDTGLKLGDTFAPTHGPAGAAHDQFHVVGMVFLWMALILTVWSGLAYFKEFHRVFYPGR